MKEARLAHFLLVALVALSACTQSTRSTRGPASADLPFEALGLESVEAQMQQRYLKIEYTTLLAYEELAFFDEHLSREKSPLHENPHYATLLAARMSIEEEQHEILELRDQFYALAQRSDLTGEESSKAMALLRATFPPTRRPLDYLVFEALHVATQAFTRQLLLDLESMSKREVRGEFEKLYHELAPKWGPLAPPLPGAEGQRQLSAQRRSELKQSLPLTTLKRNLEHVAQELRVSLKTLAQKSVPSLYPSTGRAGNIVGSEFPAKVWSLTFDDGPGNATTQKILDHLTRHNLKASFFQLTRNVRALPGVARQLREAGMEIASHSYTHQQITKLAPEQRDREIRVAASELGELSARPIKFYRLPYGAGVSNGDIHPGR